MQLNEAPTVRAEMLIRRPAADVFRAFADPEVTTRFWFTRGSGPLAPGAQVRWDWEMYGVGTDVTVVEMEPGRRIVVDWDDPATRVTWDFAPRGDGTFVTITHAGFAGTGDEVVRQALDSMGGFSLVLAAAKAWLEHGVELNLVADHSPESQVQRES